MGLFNSMHTPAVGGLRNVTAPQIAQQKQVEAERTLQQQQQQQQQMQSQDLSKGTQQTTTVVNATYAIINGKPTLVSGNKTNSEKTSNTDRGKRIGKNDAGRQSSLPSELREVQKTSDFYATTFGYSRMADSPLTKGLSLSSVGKGMQINSVEDDDDISSTNSDVGHKHGDESSISALAENFFWIGQETNHKNGAYHAKINVSNQDNRLMSRTNKTLGSTIAVNAYASTQEAFENMGLSASTV